MYTITHIVLSIQTKELYNAMEISQSLSTHRITKQYQTTVHFHLNLTKNIHMLVHKTHYMILRSMNIELPCSHSNNMNHHNYHTGSLRWYLKNFKFSLLLLPSQSFTQQYWFCLILDFRKFIIYWTLSGKYFKLFTNNGLEKIAQSHDFGTIIITEHNIYIHNCNIPWTGRYKLLNIQHSMQGWQVHCDV